MADWVAFERAIPVAEAETLLPHRPGKYAFFVSDLSHLPQAFQSEAQTRPNQHLLYIGKADVSLFVRVWEQECLHQRPGTFFRSVGAMLGFRSPVGGKNYEFSADDKQAVIKWICRNLRVAWTCEQVIGSHRESEKALIQNYTPLLNLLGNPRKFSELQRLRELCRLGMPASA
ncbi:GIY-YIG nuclease family protein [Novosphingobium sp.]|uniref:GIY-YIG nuclease family protein n=1 Tax=Novosphingobium sp. TaxID=1874826 RepID=UPI0035B1B4C0